mgnify:CR=1 FL=1
MRKFSSGGEQTAFDNDTLGYMAGGLMGSKDFNISMIKAQEEEPNLLKITTTNIEESKIE